jgi:hypothetical protein
MDYAYKKIEYRNRVIPDFAHMRVHGGSTPVRRVVFSGAIDGGDAKAIYACLVSPESRWQYLLRSYCRPG